MWHAFPFLDAYRATDGPDHAASSCFLYCAAYEAASDSLVPMAWEYGRVQHEGVRLSVPGCVDEAYKFSALVGADVSHADVEDGLELRDRVVWPGRREKRVEVGVTDSWRDLEFDAGCCGHERVEDVSARSNRTKGTSPSQVDRAKHAAAAERAHILQRPKRARSRPGPAAGRLRGYRAGAERGLRKGLSSKRSSCRSDTGEVTGASEIRSHHVRSAAALRRT